AVNAEGMHARLDHPASLGLVPDIRRMLVSVKARGVRRWKTGMGVCGAVAGVRKVWAIGQGGLLAVVLARAFAESRGVWLSYAEADPEVIAGTASGF
ncbi:PQQ-dependent sugar dehydrogenase, partial [Salmonella enterica]|uniref:PQQ-dependent sugar dehydrogenase n=1 Tax=Salmonella enterica TaxID=28901 RepID=UPI000AC69082